MKTKVLGRDEMQRKIAVVVGTRPGIVKFGPVIRELDARGADFFVIHTGQHYSENMDRQFFIDLKLREPSYHNPVVREFKTHGGQTAEMIKGVEQALIQERPRVVIVGGDANTNLAGALAARKLAQMTLVHMEAGLRSHDWLMPEEHNRVMIDHISDVLLAPTEAAVQNLKEDNVQGRVVVTGNTIVDAVLMNIEVARPRFAQFAERGIKPKEYFLLTAHREENVDSEATLRRLLNAVDKVAEKWKLPIVFPLHPRTRVRLETFGLWSGISEHKLVSIVDPLSYLDFLAALSNAKLVLTDSGGIQEEACILGVPCVTLRENTERPETVAVGANIIAGTAAETVLPAIETALNRAEQGWKHPFGDGQASRRIVDILLEEVSRND